MGAILSRKKEPKFEQVLENLEKNISALEERKKTRYQFQRKLVIGLLVYSIVIEVVIAIWFYFTIKPVTNLDKFINASPLLGFPLIVYILKVLISSYYAYRIKKDDARLTKFRAELKLKLEQRKKSTDFEETQKLLSKYEKIAQKNNSPLPTRHSPPSPPKTNRNPVAPSAVVNTPANNNLRQRPQGQPHQPPQQQQVPPQQKPAHPTTPTKRGLLDKLVDYMVGVNSQNGFALLCSNCKAHNGLAPASELENIQFRCRFCNHFNEQNPTDPKVSQQQPQHPPQQIQHQQNHQQQQASTNSPSKQPPKHS